LGGLSLIAGWTLGLPELARDAARDPAANGALLSSPELTGTLLYELTPPTIVSKAWRATRSCWRSAEGRATSSC
jgi:hypothetical protein